MLIVTLNNFCFHPSVRPNSTTDYADVHIYEHVKDNKNVVIICEPVEYEGMSVTNGMTYIIDSLIKNGYVDENDVFIEHYPEGCYSEKEESFDIVRYKNTKVSWAPFSREETEHMIGEDF